MRMCWIGRRVGFVAVAAGLLMTGCAEHETSTADPDTPGVTETPGASGAAGAQQAPAVRYHASFTGKEGQTVLGAYHIEDHDGGQRLVLDDAFKSDSGPDLHVVLSPVAPGEATGANAMAEGKAFVVGKLTSLAGAQTYDLPADLDLSVYQSVLIHCIKYSHLYAAAPLE